jgi:hypothetical protein
MFVALILVLWISLVALHLLRQQLSGEIAGHDA